MASVEAPRGWFYDTNARSPFWTYAVKFGSKKRETSTGVEKTKAAPVKKWRTFFEECETKQSETVAVAASIGKAKTYADLRAIYWEREGAPILTRDMAEGKSYSWASNLKWSLEWLGQRLDKRDILTIDDDVVADLVAKRQAEPNRNGKVVKLISNRTVNQSMTDVLQKTLFYARDVLKVPVQAINWRERRLSETRKPTRELTRTEEPVFLDAARADFVRLHQFTILSGVRRGELISMVWGHVDLSNRSMQVKGKTGWRPIPISDAMAAILTEISRLPGADCGNPDAPVWTFVAERTATYKLRGGERVRYNKDQRYPVTQQVLRSEIKRIRRATGIKDYSFKSHRSTAGSRITRSSGLVAAQVVLGHADIKTTREHYAHVSGEDVLSALNKAAEQSTFASANDDGPHSRSTLDGSGKKAKA